MIDKCGIGAVVENAAVQLEGLPVVDVAQEDHLVVEVAFVLEVALGPADACAVTAAAFVDSSYSVEYLQNVAHTFPWMDDLDIYL